jgi:hypothetical protein
MWLRRLGTERGYLLRTPTPTGEDARRSTGELIFNSGMWLRRLGTERGYLSRTPTPTGEDARRSTGELIFISGIGPSRAGMSFRARKRRGQDALTTAGGTPALQSRLPARRRRYSHDWRRDAGATVEDVPDAQRVEGGVRQFGWMPGTQSPKTQDLRPKACVFLAALL